MGKKDRLGATGFVKKRGDVGKADEWKIAARQKRKGDDSAYKKNWNAFNEQLRTIGLCLRTIGSDGNCLFRAIADQLYGIQDRHGEVRTTIVDYMKRHPLDFAPFCFDCTFEDYCNKMRKNGEWGDAACLAAATRVFGIHITVHQYAAPRLQNIYDPNSVTPDDNVEELPLPVSSDTRTIHLSFHDAEHYSSVRNISDVHSFEPATEIIIPTVPIAAASSSSSSSATVSTLTHQETIVTQSIPCSNIAKIRKLLRESWNDPDVVVEMLYAEQALGLDINVDWDQEAKVAEKAMKEAQAKKKEEEKKNATSPSPTSSSSSSASSSSSSTSSSSSKPSSSAASSSLSSSSNPSASSSSSTSSSSLSLSSTSTSASLPHSSEEKKSVDPPRVDDGSCMESDDDGEERKNDVFPQQTRPRAQSEDERDAIAAVEAFELVNGSAANGSASTSSSAASKPASKHPKIPPIRRPTGREKKIAQKQQKMQQEKEKRANKGAVKKEREQAERIEAMAQDLGAVRI